MASKRNAIAVTTGLIGLMLTACGSGVQVVPEDIAQLEARLELLESTTGRNRARTEDLEERVFLLQDRVDTVRLALERRNTDSYPDLQQAYANAQQVTSPYASPPTAYPPPPYERVEPTNHGMPDLPVQTVTPEGFVAQEVAPAPGGDEIVVTQEYFEQYIADIGWGTATQSSSGSSVGRSSSGSRGSTTGTSPHASVVTNGDRLPVTSDSGNRINFDSSGTGGSPLAMYREALDMFNQGSYDDALVGMQAFLGSSPDEDYMDNALFWIGECYYGLGDYSSALANFQRVVSDFPGGNKVPDSLLKVALTHERLSDVGAAVEVLQVLVDTYPTTEAARRAGERLRELQ